MTESGQDFVELLFDEVARLDPAAARRLYLDVMGRTSRAAGGLKVVLAIDALRLCAASGLDPISARVYAPWRTAQPDPREIPSEHFISRAFDDRWAAALDAAGLSVTPGRRVQQRNPETGGFERADVLAALTRWVASDTKSLPPRCRTRQIPALTFTRYVAWAEAELRRDPAARLPLSAPTFRRHFRTWACAVEVARRKVVP